MNTPTEQLAERLRELPLEHPRPHEVTARVLAATARPSPRRRPSRLALAAALFLAALPVVWGVLYFSPATAAVLADASGPGGFSSETLNNFGLGAGNTVTAQSSSATSSGYTVQLVGAYADSIRTVVLFKITPGAWLTSDMHLTDQFGTSYSMRNGEGDFLTGDNAFSFEPASALASVTGMRFTLSLDRLAPDQRPGTQPHYVSGPWTLKGVVLLHSGTNLALPGEGSLGSGTVKFVEARYSGRVVSIRAELRGVSLENIPAAGPGTKPRSRFKVELVPAGGGAVKSMAEADWSSNDGATDFRVLFLNVDPGTYQVTFAVEGAGTLTRTLVVR